MGRWWPFGDLGHTDCDGAGEIHFNFEGLSRGVCGFETCCGFESDGCGVGGGEESGCGGEG
jgi:hypothetical protein